MKLLILIDVSIKNDNSAVINIILIYLIGLNNNCLTLIDNDKAFLDNGVFNLEGKVDDKDIVIIHDGIRPLVDATVLTDVIQKAKQYGDTFLNFNNLININNKDDNTTIDKIINTFITLISLLGRHAVIGTNISPKNFLKNIDNINPSINPIPSAVKYNKDIINPILKLVKPNAFKIPNFL